MGSKRVVWAGVGSAAALAAAVAVNAARGAQRSPLRATSWRDTVRDSLLVSDSMYQGWKWWHIYCYRCHGQDAIGGVNPAAPDLRWAVSPGGANFPRDSFTATALNGRVAKGMPAWNVLLDTTAILEIYSYVKARADGWLKPGHPYRLSDLQAKGIKAP